MHSDEGLVFSRVVCTVSTRYSQVSIQGPCPTAWMHSLIRIFACDVPETNLRAAWPMVKGGYDIDDRFNALSFFFSPSSWFPKCDHPDNIIIKIKL